MTYTGTIAPLVTPVDAEGRVHEASVAGLIASIRAEVTGLMPALSSGEGWKLTETQWRDMVTYAVRYADGLPVLAGIHLPDTDAVIERAKVALALGAATAVVTTPFRSDITQEEIYLHYRRIREAVDIPLFLYNEEAVSGNKIELATLLRICELPGIVGIKESSGSAEYTRQAAAALSIPVFEGWENLLSDVPGIAGMVGPLANLDPALCNAVLVDPAPDVQKKVDEACERYGIFRDDWYRYVKEELHRREVIAFPDVVAER
ncbi:dihydrodipicolinate synthase family protein [Kitasatospora sp. NPDC048540]|uniref:dihydrodipicolinate synthase family protein n=1 Tax=Kitasatospora sp. NPDC048540 TaxID=3155634 RepID=UPI0033DBCE9D